MNDLMFQEKRQFPRHPTEIPIEVAPEAGVNSADFDHLQLKNMSFGGLAFTAQETFTLGDIIQLRILSQSPFTLTCRVVWVKPMKEGSYEIGVEFVSRRSTAMEQLVLIEMYRKLLTEKLC